MVAAATSRTDEGVPGDGDAYLDSALPGHFLFRAAPYSYRQILAEVDTFLPEVQAVTANGDCMAVMTRAGETYPAECHPESFFKTAQVMHLCGVVELQDDLPVARAPGTFSLVAEMEPWAMDVASALCRRINVTLESLPVLTGLFDFDTAVVGERSWVRDLSYLEYAGRHPASGVPLVDYVTAFELLRMAFVTRGSDDPRETVSPGTWARMLDRQEAVHNLLLHRAGQEPLEGFPALADFHRGKIPPRVEDAIAQAAHVTRKNCRAAARYHFAAQALGAESLGPAGSLPAFCEGTLEEDELVRARREGETLARSVMDAAVPGRDRAR